MNIKAMLITAWIWVLALATAYETGSGTFPVCKSSECMQRAKLINESLNTSIDPCVDFYSYVCDRWESNHPLTDGRKSYNVYDEIRKDIPEMLSYILGNRTRVESNQSIIDKVAAMYNACLALPDTSQALIRVLNESGFNGWPILTEENIFNSTNSTDLLRYMNISAIAHVELSKHSNKRLANPYAIYIKPIPVQETIKKKVRNISALINNTMRLLNPGIDSLMLQNVTNELVQFANNLSAITAAGRSLAYNISSLQAKFTNIPISDLLKKEFGKVNITLMDTDTLNVYNTYYDKLNNFIATANPNTLYNYAGFLAIYPYIQYVNMSTEDAISYEVTQSTTRGRNWRKCIALIDESAPDILDYLYVTNDPNHVTIKNEMTDITRRLHQALNETLRNNTWLDNTTLATLQKKLENVEFGIGYPDMLINISLLETRYQYVPFFPLNISFTEAMYYIKENSYKMRLCKLRYPEEGNLDWDYSPRNGRPSHDRHWTKIDIPYTLFVSPFFQQGLPRSLNYGGIGGAIAYQLAHSISIIGIKDHVSREYEKFMTPNSVALFKNRTSCFLKQYKAFDKKLLLELDDKYNENTSAEADEHEAFFAKSSKYDHCYMAGLLERHNITEEGSRPKDAAMEECLKYWREYHKRHDIYWPNLRVHWSLTLDEDVADNTGLHTAFNAYEKFLEECEGQDPRLTGLEDFSAMQLFFISNARTQCRIVNNATLIYEIRWSQYSTARNRVNGAMKNLEGFAKAFNCSIGSPMNPAKNETCSFW